MSADELQREFDKADRDICDECGDQLVEDEEVTCGPCLYEAQYRAGHLIAAAKKNYRPSSSSTAQPTEETT